MLSVIILCAGAIVLAAFALISFIMTIKLCINDNPMGIALVLVTLVFIIMAMVLLKDAVAHADCIEHVKVKEQSK
jgi:hypothetical protein